MTTPESFDLCIYGATPGGVVAAVTARQLGHSVVLLETGQHVGGMTSGGLGWTDYGIEETIGGLARSFFDPDHGGIGRGVPDERNGWHNHWSVIPGQAEAKFMAMLKTADVDLRLGQRIDRNGSGVKKSAVRIHSIRMEDGTEFSARVFIDCSYEGDLMAEAGVSWRKDRESRDELGEAFAGVIGDEATLGIRIPQLFTYPIDPYVVPGQPDSGLLPGIQDVERGNPGERDDKIQAYCYRSCLTSSTDSIKRIEITEPDGYDPLHYELLRRHILAHRERGTDLPIHELLKISPLSDDKTDINARGPLSIDFIGESWTYTEADYAERERICQRHADYTKGLFWFLKSHPDVPADVRTEMAQLAYPADEYTDNAGWSHQLYVREARRMVGSCVMRQNDVRKHDRPVEQVIGMGSYGVDSHHIQRNVLHDADGKAYVQNEGNFLAHKSPYPIPYGAILPKAVECDNLLVTFCVSASHVAFSSIRMEPVLMILSQSAAHAASLAIQADTGVQNINYATLRQRLIADGQILTLK